MIKLKGFGLEPVVFNENGWYYWDETWSNPTGPFPSYTEALANLLEYCEELNAPDFKDELMGSFEIDPLGDLGCH